MAIVFAVKRYFLSTHQKYHPFQLMGPGNHFVNPASKKPINVENNWGMIHLRMLQTLTAPKRSIDENQNTEQERRVQA